MNKFMSQINMFNYRYFTFKGIARDNITYPIPSIDLPLNLVVYTNIDNDNGVCHLSGGMEIDLHLDVHQAVRELGIHVQSLMGMTSADFVTYKNQWKIAERCYQKELGYIVLSRACMHDVLLRRSLPVVKRGKGHALSKACRVLKEIK